MKATRRTLFLLITVLAFAQAALSQSLPTFGWMRAGQNFADRFGLGLFPTAWSPDSSLVAVAMNSAHGGNGWVNLYRSSDGMLLTQFQGIIGNNGTGGGIDVAFLPGNSLPGHPENLLMVNDNGGAVPANASRVQVFSTSTFALLSTNFSSTITWNQRPFGPNLNTFQVNSTGDSVLINGNIYSTSTVLSNQSMVMNGIINGGTVVCLATALVPPNDHQCLFSQGGPPSYIDYSSNTTLYTWPGNTPPYPIAFSSLPGIYVGATSIPNASGGTFSASSFLPVTGGWGLPFNSTDYNDFVDGATFAPNGNAVGLFGLGSGPGASTGCSPYHGTGTGPTGMQRLAHPGSFRMSASSRWRLRPIARGCLFAATTCFIKLQTWPERLGQHSAQLDRSFDARPERGRWVCSDFCRRNAVGYSQRFRPDSNLEC